MIIYNNYYYFKNDVFTICLNVKTYRSHFGSNLILDRVRKLRTMLLDQPIQENKVELQSEPSKNIYYLFIDKKGTAQLQTIGTQNIFCSEEEIEEKTLNVQDEKMFSRSSLIF